MKKLLKGSFAALSAVVIMGLTSCLSGEGENSQTFAGEPLVVTSSSPTTVVDSRLGVPAYVPELNEYGYGIGTCLLANFKIDFDNQPSTSGYTLTEVGNVIKLGQNYVYGNEQDSTITGYNGVIVGTQVSASSELLLLQNKIFFSVTQKANQGGKFDYNAVWIEGDRFLQNSRPTLYLSVQISGEANNPSDKEGAVVFALDLTEFIQECKSSSSSSNFIDDDVLSFNVRYRTENAENGTPVFSKPIIYKITLPKES